MRHLLGTMLVNFKVEDTKSQLYTIHCLYWMYVTVTVLLCSCECSWPRSITTWWGNYETRCSVRSVSRCQGELLYMCVGLDTWSVNPVVWRSVQLAGWWWGNQISHHWQPLWRILWWRSAHRERKPSHEVVSTRIDREADGFLRGIIVANNINISGGPHSFFLYFSGYSSSTSAAVIEDFEMFRVLNSKLPDPACKRRQSPILMVVPSHSRLVNPPPSWKHRIVRILT